MAITRERKEDLVATYGELLRNTDGFIVAEYNKMTVAKVDDLRNRLREGPGGVYAVTNNTLFRIALQENGWNVPDELFVGQTGVIFGNGNLPAVAKTVQGYIKDNAELLSVRGGVLAGAVFSPREMEAVANLPTLEEIHAQLAGLVVQPAAILAGLLESATSQVVNVVQAYLQKHEEGEAAA